ncbi:hypothetical protein BU17DRAFT_65991 [Hysterangium stoloniferum]|nr:hypothetical protein BU17DRAFT_65991 [Hysterangium stoloniferum]
MEQQKKRRAYQHHYSRPNQSRRGALLPPSLPLFHFTGPSGLQRKDHAETIEDIRENPREREGESRTKRHIIQLEYPEGAQKEKEKETGADATRQEGTGILLNSDIRGRIAVAPKRISTNPPSLPLDKITLSRRAIFSNAAAFNVSIEGRDIVHALQPPRHYNSPSLLQRSDWLSGKKRGGRPLNLILEYKQEEVSVTLKNGGANAVEGMKPRGKTLNLMAVPINSTSLGLVYSTIKEPVMNLLETVEIEKHKEVSKKVLMPPTPLPFVVPSLLGTEKCTARPDMSTRSGARTYTAKILGATAVLPLRAPESTATSEAILCRSQR